MSRSAIAWYTEGHLTDKSATTYDPEIAALWIAKGWPVTALFSVDKDSSSPMPNVFCKGFNTLETGGGKYKIVMQFSDRDDAWAAYNELCRQAANKESK
jgi:hypothetical protein